MKRILYTAQFISLLLCFMTQSVLAQDNEPFSINESPLPKPTSPIMDYAGVIDSATKQRVEQSILQLKEETDPSVELAVAIVKTTGDRPIFDYSIAVARGWGIGSREQDNPGALLFIAVEDRKYYTQVSSDLEDELPDGLVGSLQRQYLVPQFKKGNYSKGVEDTINAYIDVINSKNIVNTGDKSDGGEFVPSSGTRDTNPRTYDYDRYNNNDFDCSFLFPCIIVLGILIFIIISNSGGGGGGGRRRKHKSTGDDVVGDIVTGILAGLITGGGGGGSSSSDWGSGGSSWGGGGGSSGGGWGGFGGGGDFGGGGAGGGW